MVQDASLTYQQFKNCRDNLSSWLEQLPQNQVRPSDGPSQIAYKLQAQKVRGLGLWVTWWQVKALP
jgi:envoplakin